MPTDISFYFKASVAPEKNSVCVCVCEEEEEEEECSSKREKERKGHQESNGEEWENLLKSRDGAPFAL